MKQKIGLALAGGGARGLAHIGVIKALHEHNIYPTHISGSSAGAIVGSLYAAGNTTEKMLEVANNSSLFQLFRAFGLPINGLAELKYLREILEENIPGDNFDVLEKQLYVCTSNLNTGNWEIFSTGKLFDPVVASSSIPLLFKPIAINGQFHVDGGLLNNLPVEPLLKACDVVIGVNVIPHQTTSKDQVDSLWDIGYRCFDLTVWANVASRLAQCHVGIDVAGLAAYDLFDFRKGVHIAELGYLAAKAQMPAILALLNPKDS